MLNVLPLRIALGCLALALTMLGFAASVGRAELRQSYRRVTIEIFNNNSIIQVFVNCHEAARVSPEQVAASRDLGWLKSTDRVFISATSTDARPSFGFLGLSNGKKFIEAERGNVEVLGFPAEPDAVVFAKGFLASGAPLGNTGCQPPGVVAVRGYLRSPTDADVPAVKGDGPSYRPRRAPYDEIDAIGSWALIPLAALGLLSALAIGPVRRLIMRHQRVASVAVGAATVTALFLGSLGAAPLLTTLKVGGTLLLLAVAIVLVAPPLWHRLEPAGSTPADGTDITGKMDQA